MHYSDIKTHVTQAVTRAQAFLVTLFQYASSLDVLKLDIQTVTPDNLVNLTEPQFNILRYFAVKTQNQDLATLVIWSSVCKYLQNIPGFSENVILSNNNGSDVTKSLKSGICSWLDRQPRPSDPLDKTPKRKSLLNEVFNDPYPMLIIELSIDTLDDRLAIELGSISSYTGMKLITLDKIVIPSLDMLTKIAGIISGNANPNKLMIKPVFTDKLSEPSEIVELLTKNSRPVYLPDFLNQDPDPDMGFDSGVNFTIHELSHLFEQNRPGLTQSLINQGANWAGLILEAAEKSTTNPEEVKEILRQFKFENISDLQRPPLNERVTLHQFLLNLIPPDPQTEELPLMSRAAFRLLTDLYLMAVPLTTEQRVNNLGIADSTGESTWPPRQISMQILGELVQRSYNRP